MLRCKRLKINLEKGLKNRACVWQVCLIDKNGREALRLVDSRVVTKRLSEKEIADYVATREWVGCCGYKIEGCFAGFVRKIVGSYSGIVGLPLYETQNLLNGAGIK